MSLFQLRVQRTRQRTDLKGRTSREYEHAPITSIARMHTGTIHPTIPTNRDLWPLRIENCRLVNREGVLVFLTHSLDVVKKSLDVVRLYRLTIIGDMLNESA